MSGDVQAAPSILNIILGHVRLLGLDGVAEGVEATAPRTVVVTA